MHDTPEIGANEDASRYFDFGAGAGAVPAAARSMSERLADAKAGATLFSAAAVERYFGAIRERSFYTLDQRLGAFLSAIAIDQRRGRRLGSDGGALAALGVNPQLAEDGGVLVPEGLAEDLIESLYEAAIIAPLCDLRTSSTFKSGAELGVPVIGEKSRADGSRWGGARAYWLLDGEAPATASRPKFNLAKVKSRKLVAVSYASAELAADAPMLGAHVRRAFQSEMGFLLDQAIVAGDGAGLPLGYLNAPATIEIAKETGQAAATIVAENIAKMWARLPLASRRRAVWLVNEDVESKLPVALANTGNFLPAGSDGIDRPRVHGRPVIAIEQAPVLGSRGDLSLGDLSQYLVVDGGEMNGVLSIHLQFANDELCWRFVYNVDGQPAWSSPVTPFNGSGDTRSPFITLAARP